ncbi:hypothetical protein V8E36_005278 [Tilletia maclaganii]
MVSGGGERVSEIRVWMVVVGISSLLSRNLLEKDKDSPRPWLREAGRDALAPGSGRREGGGLPYVARVVLGEVLGAKKDRPRRPARVPTACFLDSKNHGRRNRVEARTWEDAVRTLSMFASFLLVLALIINLTIQMEPSLRAYLQPVMHPIGLHRLLFCRTSACVSPEDLTGGKWSGHGDEARTVLMLMSMVVFLLGWVLTVLAVLVSAWRRYGWADGVKAIWKGADHGWSHPHAGWANEAPKVASFG